MATTSERVDQLLDAPRRGHRVLVTPEGVPLDLSVAGCGERLAAFGIDFAIIVVCVLALSIAANNLIVRSEETAVVKTLVQFVAFLLRTFYFAFFELFWQGRTPGKKVCNLRVINRDGGELTADAVAARNLIREAEFFFPLALLFSLDADAGSARQLSLLGWAVLGSVLPLLNRERLRPGDIIAGTQVIAMPKRALLPDLSVPAAAGGLTGYEFSRDQLSKYGAYELQVLEELLRRPVDAGNTRLLNDVCERICRKIEWREKIPPENVRRFLTAFYAAEREELERGKLFGKLREDKDAGP